MPSLCNLLFKYSSYHRHGLYNLLFKYNHVPSLCNLLFK